MRKRSRAAGRSFLLLLVLSVVASACTGFGSGLQPSVVSPELKPITLKFSVWGSEERAEMYQEMAAEFRKSHPNVDVDVLYIPFNDYQQKLSIMIASKTAPDLGWIAERMIPQFMAAEQLIDISELKTDPEYNFNDFYPTAMELFSSNGRIYGIPFSTPPTIMFYNETLFRAKGLQTPIELYEQGDWTYEQLIQTAKALTDPAKGVYGVKLASDLKEWTGATMSLFRAYGAEMFDSSGSRFTLNSPGGREAMQLFSDLMFKYKAHPKAGDQTTFESGKLGMYQFPYSYVETARRITDFEWDIAPLPAGPSGAISAMGIAGYSIFKGAKHPKEALEFLKFISQPNNMEITSGVYVPSRQSVLKSDAFMNSHRVPSRASIQLAVIDQMKTARLNPSHENWQKIDTEMRVLFDLLYTQSKPVNEILDEMEETITRLLK